MNIDKFWLFFMTIACFIGFCWQAVLYRRSAIALQKAQNSIIASDTAARLSREHFDNLQKEISRLNIDLSDTQAQLSAQSATLTERESSYQSQLKWAEESREKLRSELEVAGQKLVAASGKELENTNQKSMDSLLKPLSEKIDQFQFRVNQVHSDLVQNSATLSEQIKNIEAVGISMSGEANNLARALKGDKKLVGNWGEAQLEKTLELAGLRRGEHFDAQVMVKDEQGNKHLPDFVIRLPEAKNLIIDSKVSLVSYEKAVTSETEADRSNCLKAHAKSVKQHIDDLSEKNYANLPGMQSPDFVLMFMPVEPAYIEVMRDHRELFNYGYAKNVVLVSHTTLMPILRTVANLWMVEHSNNEAREISARAGDIYNNICLLGERMQSLGSAINNAANRYNDALTTIKGKQGLVGKVSRFQSLSQRANKVFPAELDQINPEVEVAKLPDPIDSGDS